MSCSERNRGGGGEGEEDRKRHEHPVLQRSVELEPNSVSQNGSITASQLTIDENLLVDPRLLLIGAKIGEGAHGKVYEGRSVSLLSFFFCFVFSKNLWLQVLKLI